MSNVDILKDVQRYISPAERNVKIDRVRKIKDGIIINCEGDSSLNNLKASVDDILGSKYCCESVTKLNPRINLKNVDLRDVESDDKLLKDIFSLNDLNENFILDDMKIITKLKYSNSTGANIILETTPALRKFLLSRGFLYVNWKKCFLQDHLRILKCKVCLSFGHTEKKCNSTQKCLLCSGEHDFKSCDSEVRKCINCVSHNTRSRIKNDVNHSAGDRTCPVYISCLNRLQSKINYG